jgi:hypothetical protein
MRPRRVEVRIEELVLHGFPPLDARAVGDAVERELAELIGARPPPAALAGQDRVDAGSFDAAIQPAALGAGVAGQIRQVLG